MARQPILNDAVEVLGEIRLCAVRGDTPYVEGKTEVDGAHIHSCYELYVNLAGDISFFHGSEVYDVRPLDVVVSHPADVHHCIYHASCLHAHWCVWLEGEAIGAFLARRGIRGRLRLPPEKAERLPHLLEKLTARESDPFLRAATLMELLALLDTTGQQTQMMPSESFPAPMREMLRYIDLHLSEIDGWETLSREFFLSKSTVNRMFRQYVGISVGKLIEAKRLAYAEKLLRTGASVTDVCYRAGFSDCSRFIAAFKKKFGRTPHKYKQAVLSRDN